MKFVSQVIKEVKRPAFAKPVKWIALFSVVTNLLILAVPIHMLQVYDRVLASGSLETLIYITLITVAALAFYSVAEAIRGMLAQRLSARFSIEYSENLFRQIVKNGQQNENNQLLRDLNSVQNYLSNRSAVAWFDLPFAPLFLVLMFFLHFTLGLIATVAVLLMIGVAVANKNITADYAKDSAEAGSEAMAFSLGTLRRSDDIQAMGLLPSIMTRWGKKMSLSIQKADQSQKFTSLFYGLSKAIRQTLQVIVMAWGAYLVIQGDMSGGMIFASTMILGKVLTPIEQLIGGWANSTKVWESYKRVVEATEAIGNPVAKTILPEPRGEITVQNLVFSPDPEQRSEPVLDGISFKLDPGVITALMGPSGGGKSSLAKLLIKATNPTSGSIRLDGFELDQWDDHQRGNAIGYIPQDIMLFPGTVAENIARLEPNPNDERVIKAALKARVHDLISSLPDGYATQIGPNAVPLSGGQRQRIALARAFYSNPRVLILDEPNAHLDAEGEINLMKTLMEAKADNVTMLIVSQRKKILEIVDQVMILKDGTLAAAMKPMQKKAPNPTETKVTTAN